MGRLPRVVVIVAALAALVSLSVASPASAATPCWKRLINDWYDGRIDNVYPVRCYQQAISKLPPDAQNYSSAPEDIRRALLAAIRDRRAGGRDLGPAEYVPLPPKQNPAEEISGDHDGFFRSVLEALGPKNADSVPVPLLVLASMAFLLLAAAATSYLTRWIQARRVELAPAPAARENPQP